MTEPTTSPLTVRQIADLLHITPAAVLKRIKMGQLQAQKVKGQWSIPWPQETENNRKEMPLDFRTNPQTTAPELENTLLRQEIAHLKEGIVYLEDTIRRLEKEREEWQALMEWREQAHAEELLRLQADKNTIAAALDKAQSALLNQQSLSLPGAVREMQALPSPEETQVRRPWWRVWKR